MRCPYIWTIAARALACELPLEPIDRLGLRQVSRSTIAALFIVTHVYHALKISHLGVVLIAVESSDFSHARLAALSSSRAALALIRP